MSKRAEAEAVTAAAERVIRALEDMTADEALESLALALAIVQTRASDSRAFQRAIDRAVARQQEARH